MRVLYLVLLAALGGEAPDGCNTCRENESAGDEPHRAGGEGIAEIDQDELHEPEDIESEVRLGLGRVAKCNAQTKHEQCNERRGEEGGVTTCQAKR